MSQTELSTKDFKKLTNLAKQEAGKFGKLGEDEKFMVVNLKTVDKDGEYDLPKEIVSSAIEKFRERAPNTGVMMVSVGPTSAKVFVNVPEKRKELLANEWVVSTGATDSAKKFEKIFKFQTFNQEEKKKVEWSCKCSECLVQIPLNEGQALKYRDEVIAKAFDYLRSKNLLSEEESDEEIYTFDDE